MLDISKTITIKSDQLNVDDFLEGDKIITITDIRQVSGAQNLAINFENDNKKPFKPCLTVRKILLFLWGKDGSKYIGRSLKLYIDTNVMYAGEKVGGIRVSHMSHIDEPKKLMIAESQFKKKLWTINPLQQSTLNKEDFEKYQKGGVENHKEEIIKKNYDVVSRKRLKELVK